VDLYSGVQILLELFPVIMNLGRKKILKDIKCNLNILSLYQKIL
jgi:hypothetical protein